MPPGNAFELVYAKVRNRVWEGLYNMDAVVSESIRQGPVWCCFCMPEHQLMRTVLQAARIRRPVQQPRPGHATEAAVRSRLPGVCCSSRYSMPSSLWFADQLRVQGPADMLDELFGHMLAALRFGASPAACQSVLELAFQLHPSPQVQLDRLQHWADTSQKSDRAMSRYSL